MISLSCACVFPERIFHVKFVFHVPIFVCIIYKSGGFGITMAMACCGDARGWRKGKKGMKRWWTWIKREERERRRWEGEEGLPTGERETIVSTREHLLQQPKQVWQLPLIPAFPPSQACGNLVSSQLILEGFFLSKIFASYLEAK